MGFWNDGIRSPSPSNSPPRRKAYQSNQRGGREETEDQPPSFTRTVLGIGNDNTSTYNNNNYNYNNNSRNERTFYSGGSSGRGIGRGTSSARPRPRAGFLARVRKFLRELFEYVRRNPVKVFFLVVMPLITGGTLTRLLAHLGIRVPRSLETMAANAAQRQGMGGAGAGAGAGTGRYYARGGARDYQSGTALPGMGGGVGEALSAVAGIVKNFL